MKRLMIVLLAVLMLVGGAVAEYGPQMGAALSTNYYKIYNTSMPAVNTIYTVTLDAGAGISVNVQAVGGDIRYSKDGTTTEAYWTISDGSVFWPENPLPITKDKILYFWTTSTATPDVQALYFYYQ